MLHCAIRLKKRAVERIKNYCPVCLHLRGGKQADTHINKDIDVIVYMRLQLKRKKGKQNELTIF